MNNTLDKLCMGCFTQLSVQSYGASGKPRPTDARCPVCGYVPPSDDAQHRLAPRTVLSGKYMVGKPLGEGGFGITYLGYDLNLDIKVAIKEFYPFGFVTRSGTQSTTVQPLAGEQGEFFLKGRERFVDEAKRLARFRTFPGIVMVNDFFVENGTAYIVMEYVEGKTLKSYMAQQGGRLPAEMVLAMMRPVFESLAQIHAEGLIHRDISPDNIMVTHSGEVKLLDFGAAREFGEDGNKSLSVMLKHGYAPPEQYTSRGVQGPHTDVYALCATIYKAVTGVTPDGSMDRLMEDRLVPPSVLGAQMPYHAEAALMHGLAVKAEHRWQTMGEMYAAVYNLQLTIDNAQLGNSQFTIHNSQLPYPQDAAPQVYQQPVGGGVYDAPQPPQTSYAPQLVGRDALGAPPSPPTPHTSYAPQPQDDGRLIIAPTGGKEVEAHFGPQPTGEAVYPVSPPAPMAKKPMTAGKRNAIIAAAVGGCVVIALVIALTTRQGAPVDSTQTDNSGERIGMESPTPDVPQAVAQDPFSWEALDPYSVRSLWDNSPNIEDFLSSLNMSYSEAETQRMGYDNYDLYVGEFTNELPHMEYTNCLAFVTRDRYELYFEYCYYLGDDATPEDIASTYFDLLEAVSYTLGEITGSGYTSALETVWGELFSTDMIIDEIASGGEDYFFISFFGDIDGSDYQYVELLVQGGGVIALTLGWRLPLDGEISSETAPAPITLNMELAGLIGKTNADLKAVNGDGGQSRPFVAEDGSVAVYFDGEFYAELGIPYPIVFVFDSLGDSNRSTIWNEYGVDQLYSDGAGYNIWPDFYEIIEIHAYDSGDAGLSYVFSGDVPLTFDNMAESFEVISELEDVDYYYSTAYWATFAYEDILIRCEFYEADGIITLDSVGLYKR